MAPFWFLAGVFFTLTAMALVWPWLRSKPRLASLPALPWQARAGAVLSMAVVLGSVLWFGHSEHAAESAADAAVQRAGSVKGASDQMADSWAGIAAALRAGEGANSNTAGEASAPGARRTSAQPTSAQPMMAAIASLQGRLANGGGTADDWELLAKSYEFLGRTAEASKARAHQLPPLPENVSAIPAAAPQTSSSGAGAAVSGEVSLAAALQDKGATGTTLFIVAKSVDFPGPPVAVFRTTVGSWPVKFDLDDSQSMLPGRNLSSAGRVMVEARISRKGQPLPAAGDLQGSTGVINPAAHQPLQILIDKVVK